MKHRSAAEGSRVLIAAPFGRDAESIAELLARAGYEARIFAKLSDLAAELGGNVGVILITAEALRTETATLRQALAAQPPWSDVPFVLLATARAGKSGSEATRARLPDFVGNAVVLERPLGAASLLSALSSAMRSRQKQFEMRDRLAELDNARTELAESETRLRLATDSAEIGFWDVDPINDTLFWPSRVKAMFGISPDIDVSMADFFAGLHPDDAPATAAAYAAAADPQQRALYDVEYRTVGKEDGVIRWVAAKGRGLFDDDGRCVRLVGTAIDISARKADELALRESEEQLRLAMDAGGQGAWKLDLVNLILDASPHCRVNFGFKPEQRFDYDDLQRSIHPDDLDRMRDAVARAVESRSIYDIEYRVIRPDRSEGWIHVRGQPEYAADGAPLRMFGVSTDISRRKAAELELRSLNESLEQRVSERTEKLMQAEAALRQSQKMEAVGQLTGGIAHDFNNMLTGVIGSLDLMKRRIATGRTEGLDRFMDAASSSALRAAKLTERLLAFSRRQSLDSRPINVNALLGSLEDLLRRTVRENIGLEIAPDGELPFALADANQLESAIINLAINARDAMPDGGRLVLATTSVMLGEGVNEANSDNQPGRFVVVSVSDTGVGMAPEVLEKVFDPFFTTKPIGQGTGLGLSMVYGFARQSGGEVRIASRPGAGTTVSIYLPAHEGSAQMDEASIPPRALPGRGQTVLVVEDDPAVRMLVHEVLEELAYTAIEFEEPNAAAEFLASRQDVDLMISDVGLPGMTGRQLADVARLHRPALPILFITGYAENAAIRSGFLGANMAMITKPFALDVLAEKISDMLPARR